MKISVVLKAAMALELASGQYHQPQQLGVARMNRDLQMSKPVREADTEAKKASTKTEKSGKSSSTKAEKLADAKAKKQGSSKAAKIFKSKSAYTSKSDKNLDSSTTSGKAMDGNFLDYAKNELNRVNDLICEDPLLVDTCGSIAGLVLAGSVYHQLPQYYSLNYRAMTLAYPLMGQDRIEYFFSAFRVHRTLGLGNSLRLQGNNEEIVNEAYWNHYALLELEDGNIQPSGDGIKTYCNYITQEYEQLKQFSVSKYGETYDSASTTFTDKPMYTWCATLGDQMSYTVRTDWEHHRREVIGSMMNTDYTEATVKYTIWHWESLFSALADPSQVIPQLMESFNALLLLV